MKKDLFNRIIEYATNNEFGINYSAFISWATWNENDISDRSMFDSIEIIKKLQSDRIILGLNASVVDDNSSLIESQKYGGFHCQHTGGRDRWLLDATKNTPFEYAYMSDTLKVKETDSGKLKRILKNNPELEEEQLKLLINELSLLGNNLKIIVIGKDAEYFLKKIIDSFDGTIQYEVIPHYAKRGIKKEEFLQAFALAVNNLD